MSSSGGSFGSAVPSGPAGGDLTGAYPGPSVAKIQGHGVSANAPGDTQALVWNATLGLWVPTSLAIPAASATVTGPDAFGAAASPGAAAAFSRGDHDHGLPADPTPGFVSPTITLGTAAAAGVASTIVRSDATLLAFDTTAPTTQAFGDAASTGASSTAARRGHKHGMPATPVTSLNGGTGAIAQVNGYGITGANSNPPAPAVALTTASSFISANVALVANTPTNVTSLALAAGTWLVIGQAWYQASAAATLLEFEAWLTTVSGGGAAGAFGGMPTEWQSATAANPIMSVTFSCVVTPGATTTYFLVAESLTAGVVGSAGNFVSSHVLSGLTAVRLG